MYASGMSIVTASTTRTHPNSLSPKIKSLNYLNNVMAKWEAIDAGCPEAVMLNHLGFVCECTGDNIFIVKNGHLITPPEEAGILVGVTRQTILDLAQTAGWSPLALADWGVDLAALTGHKYLLGPQGTGALYVRPGLDLVPHLVGGTGIHSDLDTMPPDMPIHLEAGTANEPGYHGLLAALEWSAAHPVREHWARINGLLADLRAHLRDLGATVIDSSRDVHQGEEVLSASAPAMSTTPVLSFVLAGVSPQDTGEALRDSYDIIVRTGLHCAPRVFAGLGVDPTQGTVRVSLSRFTTAAEVEQFSEAISDIATTMRSD